MNFIHLGNGEEHRVTFFNRKYFFIDDEENYEKIYKSITSKYKKIKYIVEDYNFEPCKWYESSFGKHKGVGYDELFINLWTLMKIPTEELPTIVKKNCEEQAKFIQKIVDRHNYDKRRFPSKISICLAIYGSSRNSISRATSPICLSSITRVRRRSKMKFKKNIKIFIKKLVQFLIRNIMKLSKD